VIVVVCALAIGGGVGGGVGAGLAAQKHCDGCVGAFLSHSYIDKINANHFQILEQSTRLQE
jgi:hypothetical protein